jgi:hypothetical protein
MSEHHRSLDRALTRAAESFEAACLATIQADTYWHLPPVDLYTEPLLPLAARENQITIPDACATGCAYGGCGSSGYQGCGGCCHCRGGCVVAWENQELAPFLWNGDPA